MAALETVRVDVFQDGTAVGLSRIADGRRGNFGTTSDCRGILGMSRRADEIELGLAARIVFERDVLLAFADIQTVERPKRVTGVPNFHDAWGRTNVQDADLATFEKASAAELKPHKVENTLAFMWESRYVFRPTKFAMEAPELASGTRYGPKELRLAARDEVNRIVAQWVLSLDLDVVLARCKTSGAPASLIYSIADIFDDPQYRARGNIRLTQSRIGELAVPEVVPRLSATPGEIRWLGEGLGAQNAEVFGELLGLDSGEVGTLRQQGII